MDAKGHQISPANSQQVTYRQSQPSCPPSDEYQLPSGPGYSGQVNYNGYALNPHDTSRQFMPHAQGSRFNVSADQARSVAFLPQGAVPSPAVNPPPYQDPPPPYPGNNYSGPGFVSQASAPVMSTSFLTPIEKFRQAFSPDQQRAIERVLGGSIKGSTWLAYRLAALKNYELNFIIDNSASMDTPDGMVHPDVSVKMTRLEEACYRLSNIADLLAHIPVMGIKIQSFSQVFPPIDIQRAPAEIASQMKGYLNTILTSPRLNSTPLYPAMSESIKETANSPQSPPRIIYVFNDGEPNVGGSKDNVCDLLRYRVAERNPVCLVACTDSDSAVGWMNKADEEPSVHVVDDFQSEMKEVKMHQGSTFPFTEGFYLMSTLLGPIDPLFDKADENHIYDHTDYQEICGRNISTAEYEKYQKEAYQRQNGHAENNDGAGGCLIS